jgi:hypothetical protein
VKSLRYPSEDLIQAGRFDENLLFDVREKGRGNNEILIADSFCLGEIPAV